MYLQNIVLLMLKKHLVYTLILFLHLEESVSTVSFILFTHSSHSRSHRVSGGGGGGGGGQLSSVLLVIARSPSVSFYPSGEKKTSVCSNCPQCVCLRRVITQLQIWRDLLVSHCFSSFFLFLSFDTYLSFLLLPNFTYRPDSAASIVATL